MGVITKGELVKATLTWWQAHFGAVMSGSLQLLCISPNRTGVEREAIHSSPGVGTMEVKEFCLDNVWGPVHNTQRVTVPLFGTVSIHGNTSVRGHCMQVHMLAEPTPGSHMPTSVVPTATYRELHRGSSQVPICLQNLSTHSVEISTKAVVGQVMPANQVPPVVLPEETFTCNP